MHLYLRVLVLATVATAAVLSYLAPDHATCSTRQPVETCAHVAP